MNENPIEGLRRETREEAGIEIDVVTCFSDFWVGDIGEPSHMGISFSANYVAGELVTSVENSVSGGGGGLQCGRRKAHGHRSSGVPPYAGNRCRKRYYRRLHRIQGDIDFRPQAWEYAVDAAIARGLYASSESGREINLLEPPRDLTDLRGT